MTTTEPSEPRQRRRPRPTHELGPEERRRDLIRLGLIVVGVIVLSIFTGSFPTVAVVIALILMVMLHELGHFVTAKLAGMKVTEYFLGFGPRLWSTRKGETEYGVKALPVGGYVKIIGMSNLEEVAPDDEPRTYRQQSFGRRMSVAVAGSAMHMVIAFVLLLIIWAFVGVPRATPVVHRVVGTQAGERPTPALGVFEKGDRITAIDGRRFAEWDDARTYIEDHAGQRLAFDVVRDGHPVQLTVTPENICRTGKPLGQIGLETEGELRTTGPVSAVGRAAGDLGNNLVGVVKALGSFSFSAYADEVAGHHHTADCVPVGAPASSQDDNRFLSFLGFVRVAGQAAREGIFQVLQLLVLINVFVGVFNMIPLLPLDGGHVAIAIYERIRSRKGRRYFADVTKMLPVTAAVVTLLVVIGITSLYLDIVHPVANPFR